MTTTPDFIDMKTPDCEYRVKLVSELSNGERVAQQHIRDLTSGDPKDVCNPIIDFGDQRPRFHPLVHSTLRPAFWRGLVTYGTGGRVRAVFHRLHRLARRLVAMCFPKGGNQ